MIEVRAMKQEVTDSLNPPGNCVCGCVWNNDWTADFTAYEVGSCCGCGCPVDMVHSLAWSVSIS